MHKTPKSNKNIQEAIDHSYIEAATEDAPCLENLVKKSEGFKGFEDAGLERFLIHDSMDHHLQGIQLYQRTLKISSSPILHLIKVLSIG